MAAGHFEDRLRQYVRERIPAQTAAMPEDQLRSKISSALETAEGFGIRSQAGLAQFVCLCLLPGAAFYENPQFRQFISHPDVNPDKGMTLIAHHISAELQRRMPV